MNTMNTINTIKTIKKTELMQQLLMNNKEFYYIEETKDFLGNIEHILYSVNYELIGALAIKVNKYSFVGVAGADEIHAQIIKLHPEATNKCLYYVEY